MTNKIASATGADESQDRITLGILTTVADASEDSQRGLATELGIALGLANAYVKRCVRKGLVKMHAAPRHRYAYYLTPEGFAEKSRLTAHYLTRSFHFYCEARLQIDGCLAHCVERKFLRIALCGAGELAEIANLVAIGHPLTLVAVIDERATRDRFIALPLVREAASLPATDAVVLTDLVAPQRTYQGLRRAFDDDHIVVPPLLDISRRMDCGPEPA